METSVHSHIAAIHIQERMDRATAERLAREARAGREPRAPRLRFRLRRRTAPTPLRKVGAGPA